MKEPASTSSAGATDAGAREPHDGSKRCYDVFSRDV